MFCSNCGHEMNETDKFCENCGSPACIEENVVGAPVSEAVSPVSEMGEETIPDLEKEIMKNMENDLLFDMPVSQGKKEKPGKQSGILEGQKFTYEHIPPKNGNLVSGKKEKNKATKWIILSSVAAAMLMIALAVMAFAVSNPTNKLNDAVKDLSLIHI